jgi:beta-lactamase class A
MPQGSKEKYSAKQIKQAKRIEESYEKKGIPEKKAEAIAWATVNKESGGGELSGSGKNKSPAAKAKARQDSAKNAAETKQEKAKPNSLESLTKAQLVIQAREKGIAGRSTMKKAELILALRKP